MNEQGSHEQGTNDSAEIYGIALRRLSRREHSSQELATYLQRKGYAQPEVQATIAQLTEQGLVNDDRYARIMARHQTVRGKGPLYIQAKLRAKGLNPRLESLTELIEESSGRTQLEVAIQVLETRYSEARTSQENERRAFQALLRRGFSPSVAREALTRHKE